MRHAITRVIATKADAPPEPCGLDASIQWASDNLRTFDLDGHQDPATAIAYAAKHGYRATEVLHERLSLSGKTWHIAVAHRFIVGDDGQVYDD